MKIYVVHVYDAADQLRDYYVHQRMDLAVKQAASDVVHGRFEDADPDFLEAEYERVLAAAEMEPSPGRRAYCYADRRKHTHSDAWRAHVRCDAWRAHVDEMQVRI